MLSQIDSDQRDLAQEKKIEQIFDGFNSSFTEEFDVRKAWATILIEGKSFEFDVAIGIGHEFNGRNHLEYHGVLTSGNAAAFREAYAAKPKFEVIWHFSSLGKRKEVAKYTIESKPPRPLLAWAEQVIQDFWKNDC